MINVNEENNFLLEGTIGDIFNNIITDKADKLKSANKEISGVNKQIKDNIIKRPSIITRAKNSVLQFPVYVTRGIRINEAQIISKLFERVYTTLVQTVLSQNQTIDAGSENNLLFLKQFHTNLVDSAEKLINEFYTPIDDLDIIINESITNTININENVSIEFNVIPTNNKLLINENARLNHEPLTGFPSLQEKVKVNERIGYTAEKILTPEELTRLVKFLNKGDGFKQKYGKVATLSDIETMIRKGSGNLSYEGSKILARQNKNGVWEYYVPNKEGRTVTTELDAVDSPKILRDSDIKKINGMLPYTIEATFRLKTANGYDRDVRYIIGIKSILHLIDIKDLSEDLREILSGDIKTLQKVRYKTGEINFKDYFFNITRIKSNAASLLNKNKKWLNTLKRLGEYKKLNGTLLTKGITAITGGHVPIPNGTLLLSNSEVIKLINETGIDLNIVANAKRLAHAIFLISIVIIDATSGTMKILFTDVDNEWDTQSLSSIDADIAKTDNSQLMKELNKAVNR